ncbi:peptide chain release factor 1 [Pelagibacteraceae bacterium]|jgi:peptide chain release factor 1|nr:peptide chain release factor 1 [Pelagibacteraceae bacterium]
MLPINKVKEIVSRYETLEKTLSQSDIDKNTYVKNSKEYASIGDIIVDVKSYIKMVEDKEGSEKILQDKSADKELKEMAELELLEIKEKILDLETKIKIFMLPKDEADEKNAIIEIRAGTGGQEAAIFAGDLFSMYQKVATNNGWKTEIISISEGDAGGYKEIVFSVTGKNVFSKLKFESGVHRVQRVPKTETQGRVHTSAATVAVLPEAEEVDVKIDENELRIDVFRSSGPGGQSVNTTDSAVRITHLPSGIVVSQQDEKSQHKNKAKALKILRSKLYELERSKLEQERSSARKSQIGSGDRSERIRTYNFPQGRVTDHRINLTLHKLTDFLSGDVFSEISDALQIQFQEQQLEA